MVAFSQWAIILPPGGINYFMSIIELLLLSLGLAMDAFAVAACVGLTMKKVTLKKSLIVGLYFGTFQAVMPLVGYGLATLFADQIVAYDHWVAFALLSFLGVKMIIESSIKERKQSNDSADEASSEGNQQVQVEASLRPKVMLPLALATSIDALAVGISFAFLRSSIMPAVLVIGLITLLLSMIGVKIGNVFGTRFKSLAEVTGGMILILIGLKILLEHLSIISL